MKLFFGADPGMHGGIACLASDGRMVATLPMPTWCPGNSLVLVDYREVADFVHGCRDHTGYAAGSSSILIERAQAMPRQGVSSSFNYGVVFGSLIPCFQQLELRIEFISPAKWKKALGLGSNKSDAIDKAKALWPAEKFKRKDDGICEALLIAEYHRTHQP